PSASGRRPAGRGRRSRTIWRWRSGRCARRRGCNLRSWRAGRLGAKGEDGGAERLTARLEVGILVEAGGGGGQQDDLVAAGGGGGFGGGFHSAGHVAADPVRGVSQPGRERPGRL